MRRQKWDHASRTAVLMAIGSLGLLATPGPARGEAPYLGADAVEIREAVSRGLGLVQSAAENYPTHRDCFSCHHQTLPVFAIVTARAHGVEVDRDVLEAQADFTHESFLERVTDMKAGRGIGGGAMTVGYGLWALDLAGRKPDEVTEAMVAYLLKTQKPEGHWTTHGRRPPLEESVVTSTVLSAVGMRTFAAPGRRVAVDRAVARALAWLEDAPETCQEDRNFRLWGLHRLGASPEAVHKARAAVLATQRDDGGWSPRDDMASDAYATGQTLALLVATGLAPSDPAARRGAALLRKTQLPDGSWKVETRSKPVQVYFDNGDPHGKDLFISTPATCWAVAALAATIDLHPSTTGSRR